MKVTSSVTSLLKNAAIPIIKNKEEIKKISGFFANYVALISLCQVYGAFRHGTCISNLVHRKDMSIQNTVYKMILWMSHTSTVLNGLTVGCGPTIVGSVARRLFSAQRLESMCGPNINFAGNPRHPRHRVSLIAFALGIPGTLYSLYALTKWTWRVVTFKNNILGDDETLKKENSVNRHRMPDMWVFLNLSTVILSSRTMFHVGHAFARKYVLVR